MQDEWYFTEYPLFDNPVDMHKENEKRNNCRQLVWNCQKEFLFKDVGWLKST